MNIIRLGLFVALMSLCSWGFNPHKKINETAVFLLPAELAIFYKSYISQITNKAVDADKRCYIDTAESPRHFIDLDTYENIDSIPIHWSQAQEKFTERALIAKGIVPWQIYRSYNSLVEAFKNNDVAKIIRHSADLGHYIADAHVPLHTTSNYNGQFTNQVGIHALWETRLPEMFMEQYDLFIGPARYINNPLETAWRIVRESNSLVDSVLMIEKELSQTMKAADIKSYVERNKQLVYTYSDYYAEKYHAALNGMVERRFRSSIFYVASYWFSAWVDAGQPNLKSLTLSTPITEEEIIHYENKKILGREEWHD